MTLSDSIIIVLISQVPLVIFTIWNGLRRHKPEVKKLDAEAKSYLGDAVEGAGKTLTEAWKRIDILETWKRESQIEIEKLRNELRRFERAYGRAIKFINRKLPGEEIPDFMDTQELLNQERGK